jgi:hypothetical protein
MAFEADLKLGRRRPTRTLAIALVGASAIGWAIASGAFQTPGLLAVFVLFAGMSVASSLRRPSHGGGRTRLVRADTAGLHIDGALAVARRDIQGVLVSELDEGGAVVHLDTGRPFRSCSVFTASRPQADAIVKSLGLGHPDDLVRIRALPPWAVHIRWLTILLTTSPWFLFNVVRFVPPWGVLVLAGLYALIALPLVMPQVVEVAADGVLVRWLGSSRFFPFRAIEDVDGTSVGVVLHAFGRSHDIRLTQNDGARDVERDALLTRIEAGIERHRLVERGNEEALLARGGRRASEWVAAMRALGAQDAGGYRFSAIPRERLWEILEDPTSHPSARAGAAIALDTSSSDSDTRARLAAVAARTAAPSLRVAIDALGRADASDERVRIAIEQSASLAQTEEIEDLERRRASW